MVWNMMVCVYVCQYMIKLLNLRKESMRISAAKLISKTDFRFVDRELELQVKTEELHTVKTIQTQLGSDPSPQRVPDEDQSFEQHKKIR